MPISQKNQQVVSRDSSLGWLPALSNDVGTDEVESHHHVLAFLCAWGGVIDLAYSRYQAMLFFPRAERLFPFELTYLPKASQSTLTNPEHARQSAFHRQRASQASIHCPQVIPRGPSLSSSLFLLLCSFFVRNGVSFFQPLRCDYIIELRSGHCIALPAQFISQLTLGSQLVSCVFTQDKNQVAPKPPRLSEAHSSPSICHCLRPHRIGSLLSRATSGPRPEQSWGTDSLAVISPTGMADLIPIQRTLYSAENLTRLPEFLYHVQDGEALEIRYSEEEGSDAISAAEYNGGGLTETEVATKAREHLFWRHKRPTAFISAFEFYDDARNWGLQRKGPVRIYTINTRKLPRRVQKGPWQERWACRWDYDTKESEYLIFDRIPREAIVERREIKPAAPEQRK